MCKTAVQLSTALEKLLGWPRQTAQILYFLETGYLRMLKSR